MGIFQLDIQLLVRLLMDSKAQTQVEQNKNEIS